jgi:hypothetical protein
MTQRPKKRRTRSKNHYFTKVHENAIIQYTNTRCLQERTQLYIKYIQPAFNEMVDKIAYTYKFTSLPNSESLREECKIWLTTILDKYDPNKGSKAFSYFSVITKNWFIHKVKKTNQKRKREIPIADVAKSLEREYASTENRYEKIRENAEFWDFLIKEISAWEEQEEEKNSNSNETKVVKAIKEILKNPDEMEILNKKAIYLYLREITGLNTKQVANSLKKFKVKYRSFYNEWHKGKI